MMRMGGGGRVGGVDDDGKGLRVVVELYRPGIFIYIYL